MGNDLSLEEQVYKEEHSRKKEQPGEGLAGTKLAEPEHAWWIPGTPEGLGVRRRVCAAAGQGHDKEFTVFLPTAVAERSVSSAHSKALGDMLDDSDPKQKQGEAVLVGSCLSWKPSQQLKWLVPTVIPHTANVFSWPLALQSYSPLTFS